MLILSDGRTAGCLSGGCLDQDVILHGLNVIKNQKSFLITYDTSSDQDAILGVGLGCKGMIDILVEFLPPRISPGDTASHFLDFLENLLDRRTAGAAATVIQASGEIGLKLGDRVTLDDLGGQAANITNARLTDVLAKYALSALGDCRSEIVYHKSPNGAARIFVETILPQTSLVILGAGHDAMPLARLADELGFRVSAVDTRPAYATPERFPLAHEVVVVHPEEDWSPQLFGARTAAVIMSHNYLIDQAWLKRLLPLQLPYLGLMGPRKRAEKMLLELGQEGFEPGEQELQGLHNPIGLDIGADTPAEIALAILAEIQAALAGHEGGKLRQKKGAIHLAPLATQPNPLLFVRLPDENLCARSV